MTKLFFTTILCSLLHSISFVGSTVEAVDNHVLFPRQKLAVGQTLLSQNQVFEMGFFSPGKSPRRFLEIWYKSTPDVVFWVANRNNPITHSQEEAVVFMISGNRSLVISSGECIIWSVSSSVAAINPVLHLLDTGNLVLVHDTTKSYAWQSFDYPTDTMLPGMKFIDDPDSGAKRNLTSWRDTDDPSPGDMVLRIENHGLPEMVVWRGKTKIFRTGQWNGIYFGGGPHFPKQDTVLIKERLISIGEHYESSVLIRTRLDTYGSIKRYTMNARKDKWNIVITVPQDKCDEYGVCGPNGICRSKTDSIVRCQCFKGFTPKLQTDWNLQDWSGGCIRTKPLNAEGGDGFLEVRGVKYPDMLSFGVNTSISLDQCKAECLRRSTCTTYANPFIIDGESGCVLWLGDLIDTKELSAPHSKQNIYIRLPVSELDSNTGLIEDENKRPTKLILISITIGILVSAIINGALVFMTRRNRIVNRSNEDLELPVMKMETILQATNNFSTENMIGVGGFGPVYKVTYYMRVLELNKNNTLASLLVYKQGKMPLGEEIAVKRLSRTSSQGLEEFKNEVMVIAKLQHRNLIRLLGCCIQEEERILIYEYLRNKSLDYFVFEHSRRTLLTWPKRYDIIMGIARGMLYLHHDSRLKIIHRDLKTSNILLDRNLNPKISDFGLARVFEEEQSLARTKRVMGTYGYMAPEYAIDGIYSVKSDVFSLGVVLLEVISGQKNRGYTHSDHYANLLGHAWLLWKEDKSVELMDECLKGTFIASEVERCVQVGLLCVQKFAEDRPTMSSVVSMLGSGGDMLPNPKEPAYFIDRSSSSSISTSPSEPGSGTITITDLEAR